MTIELAENHGVGNVFDPETFYANYYRRLLLVVWMLQDPTSQETNTILLNEDVDAFEATSVAATQADEHGKGFSIVCVNADVARLFPLSLEGLSATDLEILEADLLNLETYLDLYSEEAKEDDTSVFQANHN